MDFAGHRTRIVDRTRQAVGQVGRRRPADPCEGGAPAAPESPLRSLPLEFTEAGSRRTLPLPEGVSQDDLVLLLESLTIEGSSSELRGYLAEDFERFVLTWGLVGSATGRALEIGANPYFTTVLLRELTDLQVTLTNSFGETSPGCGVQHGSYRPIGSGDDIDVAFDFHVLNVETMSFPFEDDEFDVVLFCEVIEHLLMDPVRALDEIRRVLRPGGLLILSTPNVARLENVARLVAGANLYDPYSGHGPYGRHNREYTRHELVRLLSFAGFDVFDHFTADVHPHLTAGFADPAVLAPLLEHRRPDLGQYIFCAATNTRQPRPGRPSEIYRSIHPDDLSSWD